MPQRILSSLSWKAGIAIAATALAAGTGATTFHLASDSHAGDHPAAESEHGSTTTTTAVGTTTTTAGADDEGKSGDATTAGQPDHPDNFGAIVSKDAQDGGVDGQEISDMAHARNDARKLAADNATTADDNGKDEADDQDENEGDDHRSDEGTEKGQDDSHEQDETND
jgi:hypothetical protein